MIVAESSQSRKLIGRLDRGGDILESLAEVCRTHKVRTGEIRALGALEQVTLCEYDQRARVYRPSRRFEGAFEILNLTGNVSDKDGKPFLHAHITVSRERDNGIEVMGGHLLGGRVFALEFVIETMDDLVLRRTVDPQTGLHLWSEKVEFEPSSDAAQARRAQPTFEARALTAAVDSSTPPHVSSAPVAASTSWTDVVDASQSSPVHASETKIKPGDWIEHPKFGRCQVERIEGDFEFISARLRNQRLIRLSLEVLALEPMGTEDGQQLFRAVPTAR